MIKKYLKRSHLFWRIAPMIGKLLPLSFFAQVPDSILIDVTNTCNLRCPVCPVPRSLTRPRGLMSMETFTALIDDLVREGKKPRINFAWSGEPTLNKHLPDFVDYANKRGFFTILSTNVVRLDAEMGTRLIKAGLNVATLCLDGLDAESHESYRIGSEVEQVKGNIQQFARLNRELGGKTRCQLQTLLTAYSEPQLNDIVAWAKDSGMDLVSFKTFSISNDGKMNEEQRKNFAHFLPSLKLRRKRSPAKPTLCRTPLGQSVVFWDGSIGLCCIDYDRNVKLPSILEKGFVALVSSNVVAAARKRGFLKQYGICKGCTLGGAEEVTRKIPLTAHGT